MPAAPEARPRIRRIGNLVHVYDSVRELEIINRDLVGMISNSYDGVCIADGDSRILLVNQAFEKVMGMGLEDSVGRRIKDLIAEGVTDTSATIHVLESRQQETVLINTLAGRQVLSTGVPVFGPDGQIERVYCNLRDVTELVRLREQFGASQRLASQYFLELQELKKSQTTRRQIITRNRTMRQVVDLAYRMAQVDSSLLILGESGVGKDLLAQIVHESSPRRETGTLVKVNCGAIPEPLLESELFGYESGAFTGARAQGKVGYFEIADKGTLFLDEIGELPLPLQVKLLAVLQDRRITRLGGTKPRPVDIRVLAATNQDLERMVRAGRFREDLYYRLNVVPIRVPPLRERPEDIPFLLMHFLDEYNQRHRLQVRLDEEVIETLAGYPWPGNVRELMNLVERLLVTAQESRVGLEHLPRKYRHPSNRAAVSLDEDLPQLKEAVAVFELELIETALARYGNRELVAHKLGVSLSTLNRRLRGWSSINFDTQE